MACCRVMVSMSSAWTYKLGWSMLDSNNTVASPGAISGSGLTRIDIGVVRRPPVIREGIASVPSRRGASSSSSVRVTLLRPLINRALVALERESISQSRFSGVRSISLGCSPASPSRVSRSVSPKAMSRRSAVAERSAIAAADQSSVVAMRLQTDTRCGCVLPANRFIGCVALPESLHGLIAELASQQSTGVIRHPTQPLFQRLLLL